MDTSCLTVLSILVFASIIILAVWVKGYRKQRGKVWVGSCSIALLLFLLLNLFLWSSKLSSCFLFFANEYIAAPSEEAKLSLVDEFFPESLTDAERDQVVKDFDNYLMAPVVRVGQFGPSQLGL